MPLIQIQLGETTAGKVFLYELSNHRVQGVALVNFDLWKRWLSGTGKSGHAGDFLWWFRNGPWYTTTHSPLSVRPLCEMLVLGKASETHILDRERYAALKERMDPDKPRRRQEALASWRERAAPVERSVPEVAQAVESILEIFGLQLKPVAEQVLEALERLLKQDPGGGSWPA